MRRELCHPLSMAGLARHCGVAERTLNEHFRSFVGLPPIDYHRRLRLAAARERLLEGAPNTSVTEVARRYGFNHAGRFSTQYREFFEEPPSATLRRGRAVTPSQPERGIAEKAPAVSSRDRPSIAVLLSAPPATSPALRGLTEELGAGIAAALSSVRSLAVMLPAPAQAAGRDPQRLAREIGARYVLTGRIVRQDPRLRFILHVVDAATGAHVWGDSIDGKSDRPHELQDRIVAVVLPAIGSRIRGAEIERALRAAPRDLDAYGLAMRALPLLYASTPDAARRALESLHRTMEIDPDYGLAAALAAWGHAQLVMYNGTSLPAEAEEQARRLIQLAAMLDDDDPLVLTARCAVHMMSRELDIAEALVTRALARDPTCGWTWGRSGWLQSYRGNSETAIRHFRRALSLGPGTARANVFAGIGSAHFNAGRYAAAASWIRRAMLEQPGMAWANRSLSVSYARLGEPLKARESLDALRRYSPDLTVGRVVTALPFKPDFLDRLGDGLSALGLPA